MTETIDRLTAILTDAGRPLAIMALTFIACAYILSPGIQEWMMERRGMMGRVFFGLILFSAVTTLVDLFLT